jgi:hypothetical protein
MSAGSRKATVNPAKRRSSLYEFLDWVLVRAPLLPVERYLALAERSTDEQAPYARLPEDPYICAALAVGSGNLFETLGKADTSGEDDRGAAGKLLRYLIRMSTRPTPYGLFAGVGWPGGVRRQI